MSRKHVHKYRLGAYTIGEFTVVDSVAVCRCGAFFYAVKRRLR